MLCKFSNLANFFQQQQEKTLPTQNSDSAGFMLEAMGT